MPSLRSANRSPIAILNYHQIETSPPRGAAFRSLYVSPSHFARQMALLSRLGYRGLSMSALMPYLKGELSGKVVGITFDDGYLNNLNNALPVLKRYGFSSTCYIVSQRVGRTNQWDSGAGIAQTPLMDAAQLRQWLAGGQEAGAHTRHHVHLPQLDATGCVDEIAHCRTELEGMTDAPVRHFCYPYGDFMPDHAEIVRMAGYDSATTTQRRRCQTGEGLMQLPRVPVLRSTMLPLFWLKVATGYEDRRRAA
jgi:peptidoglycan/xylan/chitin deacetylase (PgdA/CDA1 family)